MGVSDSKWNALRRDAVTAIGGIVTRALKGSGSGRGTGGSEPDCRVVNPRAVRTLLLIPVLGAALFFALAVPASAGWTYNGVFFNGVWINGLTYNGFFFNGADMGGLSLDGVILPEESR